MASKIIKWSTSFLILSLVFNAALLNAKPRTLQPDYANIVNGFSVSQQDFDARWPFIVALVTPSSKTQYDGQFCGGSLIDDQHVLTAAHCLEPEPGQITNPKGVAVIANSRVLNDIDKGRDEQRMRQVSDVFVHPGFSINAEDGYHNDVAVIRLVEPIVGAHTISMVQPSEAGLWGAGYGGVNAWVAGWGNTKPDKNGNADASAYSFFPAALRQVQVPIRSDAVCAASVGGGYGNSFERASNICAGIKQASKKKFGKDACQGDSGGPLIVDAPDGTTRLAGVVSWGEGCAQKYFGSYSRIDSLRSWVESIPGATDDRPAEGGPGGLYQVSNPSVISKGYTYTTLRWDPPAGGNTPERYAVYFRTNSAENKSDTLLGTTLATSFKAKIPATNSAKQWVFVIRAVDSLDNQGSATVLTTLSMRDRIPPKGIIRLRVKQSGRSGAHLSWNRVKDLQSGIEGYRIEQSINNGRWIIFEFTSPNQHSTKAYDLKPDSVTRFRIKARDNAGNQTRWFLSNSLKVK